MKARIIVYLLEKEINIKKQPNEIKILNNQLILIRNYRIIVHV